MTDRENTEEFEVKIDNLVDKIMELVREGNVRRIIVKREGKTLTEIPLNAGITIGAVTALVAPLLLGVGVIAAAAGKVTIQVEREPDSD